jgi:O-antigen/teichoic acid export membrane protein
MSNSIAQLVTFAARAISGLGAVFLVARSGGPYSLGVFQFALMLATIAPNLLGLPSLLAREIARRLDESRRWIETCMLIVLISGAVITVILSLGAWLFADSSLMARAITLAALGMTLEGTSRIDFNAFEAWERMHLEAIATCVQEAVFLAGTAFALAGGHGISGVMVAYVVSRATGASVGWVMATHHLSGPIIPRTDRAFLKRVMSQITPFAINDTMTLAYGRIDAVMLGLLRGPFDVGIYQAGTNLVLYLNVLARSVNNALYPRMSKAWPTQVMRLARLRDASLRLLGAMGIPLMVGCLLLAPRIILFFYGAAFEEAILPYELLVLVIPIRMLSQTLGTALTAVDGQTRRMVAVLATAVSNVLLNLYFIPRWSYVGTAVTTVVCESGLFIAYAVMLRRALGRSGLLEATAFPFIATLPLAAAIILTDHLHVLASAAIGTVVYILIFLFIVLLRIPHAVRRRPTRWILAYLQPSAKATLPR